MGKLIGKLISIFFKILLIIIALWFLRWVLGILQLNLQSVDLVWLGTTLLVLWLIAEWLRD